MAGRITVFSTPIIFLTVLFLPGCALRGGDDPPKISHHQISGAPLQRESVYYTQVNTSSDATIGAIYHVNSQGEATLLATNVDRAFWKDFVLALTGVAGNVGAAAIHGISFPAAKTAINATATNTNTNK